MRFSHLHCHTQFSLLDGAASIKGLVRKAKALEMPALAITDHGNMFGVPQFVKDAQDAGIKPIIGSEFYVTPVAMDDRENKDRFHQVLLAKNQTGYRNLVKLTSLGYVKGLYYKPRIDKAVLMEHAEGLIATTCCLQSEVNQTILRHGEAEGRKVFEWYRNLFGEDYYIELQRHGLQDQDTVNEVLIRWSKDYGVKMICTNDAHYIEREDSEAHDILLALQTNAELSDPNRFRFTDDAGRLSHEFYLKSPDEMLDLFDDVPESLDHTNEIVDKVEPVKLKSDLLLPYYTIPSGYADMDDYLRHLTYQGAMVRYPTLPDVVKDRIETELAIIRRMGFAGYFLIVQGFTTEARNQGVFVGPGRGSAAGSVVAYCTGIINIDPIQYGLLFERFLNPERISPPDIDIDFDDEGRQAVIDYVVRTYGRDNVAQIVTYGTMKAKTAIRDVGRVLGIPLSEVNRISKLFPDRPGLDTFDKVLNPEENPDSARDLNALFSDPDPRVRNMMRFAKTLEGSARQTGIHAAGVIIAPGNVSDYVPVAVSKEKDVITQYDGPNAEMCGLLKMDFLGLRTLSILKTAIRYVEENHGKRYDLDSIPLNDDKTFALYQKGETVATFQFESDGMRKYLKDLKPTTIDDLIAMNALFRPGPMQFIPEYIECKHGRRKVTYPHADLEPILQATYGIMVYQEQIMQVAQVLAGYSLGEADVLRRIMGKKKKEEMDQQKSIFTERAIAKGYGESLAGDVFDKMAFFAGYGFNKSHSAAYSVVAYHTAYFKANFPAEYMASVLTHNMGDIKTVSKFIEECAHMGVPVDPPNVNTGRGMFVVKHGRIQYGMEAIKGAGSGAIASLVEEREKKGPYASIFDLASRVDLRQVNKKTLECLVQSGAFDTLHPNRHQLMESLDDVVSYAQRKQQEEAMNQASLFDSGKGGSGLSEPRLKDVEPWPNLERLKREREMIGFFLSGHPLDRHRDDIRVFCSHNLGVESIGQSADRDSVTVAGIVTVVKQARDKKQRPFAFFTIEDEQGAIECIAFSDAFDKFMNLIHPDTLVFIEGNTDTKGGQPKVIVRTMERIENLRDRNAAKIRIRIQVKTDDLAADDIKAAAELFLANKGMCPVGLTVHSKHPQPLRMNARRHVVNPSDDLLRELRVMFGTDNVWLEKADISP
jgi:DNA polymerase-3 subunit alpha